MKNPPQLEAGETAVLLAALQFSVEKHLRQMNGEPDNGSYINRRIVVTEILSRVGQVTCITTLTAAVLHQIFDGTKTVKMEFERYFGPQVRLLVQELAGNTHLSELEQMENLLERVPGFSLPAKQITIAEKICRLQDLSKADPTEWPPERTRGFMTWLTRVVACCRGSNVHLENYFDELYEEEIERIRGMA